jgi:hypothetical protein
MKKWLLIVWLLVPVTGTGTEDDSFRPQLPAAVLSIPNLRWTAHIPTDPAGKPLHATVPVWIPDSLPVPGAFVQTPATVRATIFTRDPKANIAAMERLP